MMGSFRFAIALSLGAAIATGADAPPPPPTFADVVQEVIPAVVNISTTLTVSRPDPPASRPGDPMEEFMRRFFDRMPKSYKQRSLGSGVVVSPDGEILTNEHVIGGADDVDVVLQDASRFKAKVIGRDKKTDIALIRIQVGHSLPSARLGHADELRVGDWVIAIGNPFGLGETVTAGIVSAKGRAIGAGPYDDFIQTDASINPGNSGGPLLNARGEVVGINSAIFSQSGGNIGIGFAIPIDLAAHVADALRAHGKVVRGWLGVSVQDVTADLSKAMGLKESTGALVADVVAGGPAAKAGLERGDVIVAYQGRDVIASRELPIRVADTPIGTRVELRVLRGGDEKRISAEIAELKDAETGEGARTTGSDLGLATEPLTSALASRLGVPQGTRGVAISEVEPDSPAEDADLRAGDVVKEVDRTPVTSPRAFERALSKRKPAKPVLLLVQRGDATLFVTVAPSRPTERDDG